MKYQPLSDAVDAAKQDDGDDKARIVYLSPQGRSVDQALLIETSRRPRLILVSGRYEGVDERFIKRVCDDEWSLGDYVISGGELAALIVIDGVSRLLPGVLGDENSAKQDSHMDGLLDYPHFTRPEKIGDDTVPGVLLNGNHAEIERWRMKQALGRTWRRRPDLLINRQLSAYHLQLLEEYKIEVDD